MNKGIPSKFVWTRMNTNAGEPLENIVRRKNLEREAGEGEWADTFWWGVGESKGPAIFFHLADCEPEVLFSKALDDVGSRDEERFIYTTWRVYHPRKRDYGGNFRPVPDNIIVQSGPKDKYFAVVCRSPRPLNLSEGEELDLSRMRNLNRDEKKKGKTLKESQQSTAVVEYSQDSGTSEGRYRVVNLRADLVRPRFVKLGRPKRLSDSQCRLLDELGNVGKTVNDYRDVVWKIRG